MTDDPLVLVFKALDTENKGYITVEQFVSTFKEFYNSCGADGERRSSLSSNVIAFFLPINTCTGYHESSADFRSRK